MILRELAQSNWINEIRLKWFHYRLNELLVYVLSFRKSEIHPIILHLFISTMTVEGSFCTGVEAQILAANITKGENRQIFSLAEEILNSTRNQRWIILQFIPCIGLNLTPRSPSVAGPAMGF